MSDDVQSNKIDDYLLISVIATGKTTQVWEVVHEPTGQPYALKMLLKEAVDDVDEKALLKHENKVAQQLEHPNLIRSHGVVLRKTECYLILELFKTPNLKQFIFADRDGVRQRFRKLVEGVCQGLGYMHSKGWVHKDIKPENILQNRAGEVRIIDFSLAVRAASGLAMLMGGSKKGVIRGTRTYLAPETIRKQPSTPATDIYSLGITFFECLTGSPVFKGDDPQALLKKHIATAAPPPSLYNNDVTPEMDRIILKMLEKKPKDRYQSLEELYREFSAIQVFKSDIPAEEGQGAESGSAPGGTAAGAQNSGQLTPEEQELEDLMMERRDSRIDARIQQLISADPRLQGRLELIRERQRLEAERKKREQERRVAMLKGPASKSGAEKPKAEKKPRTAPQQPVPQQPMPGYYPQQFPPGFQPGAYPQMPYGMPMPGMPGYPPQGYPQPGMPQPGYMPPGYPQPGMPGFPPGMQMPPQPGMPPAAGPQPVAPQQAQPTTGQTPAKPAKTPPQPSKDSGMEFMTELPDIE